MSLYEQQMLRGRLYARLPDYKRKLAFAQEGIKAMLSLCPRTYVSLSFGKQSLVLAHMVWSVAPETEMRFLAASETWIMHDFANVIDKFLSRYPVRLTIYQTNNAAMDISEPVEWLSARHPAIQWIFKEPGDPSWNWTQVREAGNDDLPALGRREDYDGWFWGLVKEESKARSITLSLKWEGQPHPTIFRYGDGKYRCCPLASWGTLDLAAYISTYDLPMLNAYHFEGLDTRTTARVRRRPVEQGLMVHLQHHDIQAANQLIARFPELRTYI